MKRLIYLLMILAALFAIPGCGDSDDDHDGSPVFTETFFSNPVADGEIQFTPPDSYIIRQDLTSLFAGEDPLVTDEFRAFLDFPLGDLPSSAFIERATLSLVIRSIDVLPVNATVPIIVELVAYPPTALGAADFDRAPLFPGVTRLISAAEVSPSGTRSVTFDVTLLMREVQARNLNFQVRIRQDGGQFPGVIEIDDDLFPPALTVTFF